MNIVFLIGNGFDINIGLKTSYKDFYEYYNSIESKNESIKLLKNNISNNFKNWSDLELALGQYTENFTTSDEFVSVFEDLGDNLGDYLIALEKDFSTILFDKDRVSEYLCNPERYLSTEDQLEIENFKSNYSLEEWDIKVITFNYTRSLEKILNFKNKEIELGFHHQLPIILSSIEHIHGFADDRMVMGVNDQSQIKNQSFHNNRDILDGLVKSECNKAQKHTIDKKCQSQIISANLICIFGSSIGDTDNYWWNLIGEQLKNDRRLIIFTKGEEISKRWGYKKAKSEREMIDHFFSKTTLTDAEKNSLRKNVYVAVNSEMFSKIEKFTNVLY